MAIEKKRMQQRYGTYDQFQAEKENLLPNEFASVTSGDPNTSDGKGLYFGYGSGNVKRIAFSDEIDNGGSSGDGGGTGGTTNYNNLSNRPQINGITLTGNKTSSDLNLQPAGNYLTQETDPTVPAWAKNPTKPTYTAEEVGALPSTTAIPTKTSDLTNDTGFVAEDNVHNIPSGGTSGQVLSKKTNTDYDVEWTNVSGGADTPRQQMQNTETTVTLQPNILYVFPEMASLTVTLAEPENTNIANEYHFFFTSGATATTLTLNDVLSDTYSIDANMKYEVSILEGVAYIKGVATNET